jgi:hypothetical protein
LVSVVLGQPIPKMSDFSYPIDGIDQPGRY